MQISRQICLLFGWCFVLSVYGGDVNTINDHGAAGGDFTRNRTKTQDFMETFSADKFKKEMWRKCSNSSYVTCAKLALVHIIEKLDTSEGYTLLPGVSLSKRIDDPAGRFGEDQIVIRNDFNDALDKYLISKIHKYLNSLTLSVKLFDKNTIDDMKSFGDNAIDSSIKQTGRGKKKYMHSLLMAGWMSGATLLALTMKTIAILSGKALLAALLSLMLSVMSAFSGKGHSEKSTTYEIITKPIVAHHSADVHEAHGSELSPNYAYNYNKRSIGPEIILRSANLPTDIEHIIRKINDHSTYSPSPPLEFSKS
ncbi:uncharacterized protein LOC135841863 isoform X2 [Planococcus citri]|uniref:uncharacterized protein LOC135841863 isoform X2 n=1 Tax=Planococcus citri TaxID=170843 RepID=UPI0031F89E3E